MNFCSSAVNSQRFLCSQKSGVKFSYYSFLVYKTYLYGNMAKKRDEKVMESILQIFVNHFLLQIIRFTHFLCDCFRGVSSTFFHQGHITGGKRRWVCGKIFIGIRARKKVLPFLKTILPMVGHNNQEG